MTDSENKIGDFSCLVRVLPNKSRNRVLEKYAELFSPLDSILDSHVIISTKMFSIFRHYIARTRIRRTKESRVLTFNGWDL